jgi:hypothetical protein
MKIPLTLVRKGMMSNVYEEFISGLKGKVKFKKYIDILQVMTQPNNG